MDGKGRPMNRKNWQPQSYLVRGGYKRTHYKETNEPIFMNSGFVYDSAEEAAAAFRGETDNYIYSRYANPILSVFEQKMAVLEGGEACIATATGMSAIFAILASCLKSGDKLVAANQLFYSCTHILSEILPRFGIETIFVDGRDVGQWEAAFKKSGAKLAFFESPTNPMLHVLDIRKISKIAHNHDAWVVLDGGMAGPGTQAGLSLGVDIVTYSSTKHIDGQGRCLGGVVISSNDFIEDYLRPFIRHTGPGLSPFNGWILEKGLETLKLRIDSMSHSAKTIAEFLEQHSKIQSVCYPGLASHPEHGLAKQQMTNFGTVISFILKGGNQQDAFNVLNRLNLIDISNNFGDAKSLMTHPATTTHSKLSDQEKKKQGIVDGLLRFSTGLEAVGDLIADLEHALDEV